MGEVAGVGCSEGARMKIRLTFKSMYDLLPTTLEADSWRIGDGVVTFSRSRTDQLAPGEFSVSRQVAVYDMGCLVGFEVIDG